MNAQRCHAGGCEAPSVGLFRQSTLCGFHAIELVRLVLERETGTLDDFIVWLAGVTPRPIEEWRFFLP